MFIEQFSTVIRLLSDSLNLIGCRGDVKSELKKKSLFLKNKKVESNIHVYGINK